MAELGFFTGTMDSGKSTGPLVSVAELRERVGMVTVLDVRWALTTGPDHPAYAAGHIPGSVFVDLDAALADPPGAGGRHPLPNPDRFCAAMRAAGVSSARPVVAYDDAAGVPASRAWWLLRHYGHPDVRVLDGGWQAWVRAGGPVETGTADVGAGDFTGAPGRMPVVDADDAAALALAGRLVDVRTAERYRGENEPVDPVAGHIPGAVNVPAGEFLQDDGTLRPAPQLRTLLQAADSRVTAGAYCGSGVTAAQAVLAGEVAGLRVALYPGSWSGWITDPTRPVATDG